VLATKLEAEKERARKAETEKPPTIVNPFGGMPPWWNSSWGAWNPYTAFPFPSNSVLLNPHYFQVLQTWLGSPRNWALMYRGTRDGFGAAQFHAKCNNVGQTISIIRSTTNYLFGGYNPNNWTSSQGYQAGAGSFLFTLTNTWSHPPTIFHWKSSHGPYDYSPYGPTFGGGHDIHVSNNSNSNNSSYTNFPHDYTDSLGHANNTFAGSKNFQVAEIEVFSLH